MPSKSAGLHAELQCTETGHQAQNGEKPWVGASVRPKVPKGVTDGGNSALAPSALSGEKDTTIG